MKSLLFIRHAKSSWDNMALSDFERPLNERGLRDAPLMAELLKKQLNKLDAIYSSDANRAYTTSLYFAEIYGVTSIKVPKLYHASPDTILSVVNDLDESIHSAAIVGHNPGMTIVANLIEYNSTDNISTTGVILVSIEDDVLWQDVDWHHMQLVNIFSPKMI